MKVSERRSCQLVTISRHGLRYDSRRSDNALLEKLKTIAAEHPRYGYRRACALLNRSGDQINHKRVYRVWREAQLSLPRRRPRKRRAGPSALLSSRAMKPNQVWTYDFVFDRCANGQHLKLLTVVDEYTRESLAIHVATSIKSRAVIAAGTVLTGSTPVYDLPNERIIKPEPGEPLVVPAGAVVVPGARAVSVGAGRDWGLSLATPVIVKYRDGRTDTRTELEAWIR